MSNFSPGPAVPLSRLCVHTVTTTPLALPAAVDAYREAGVSGITLWRDSLATLGVTESAKLLANSGLKVVSLARGGFFPAYAQAGRIKALDDTRRAIDEAAAVGAPIVVIVCGAVPGMPLPEARQQALDGIAQLIPYAAKAGVRMALEPLHPMYVADRSAVTTLTQANDLIEKLGSPHVGVVVDAYHLWWDDRLEAEIARAGRMNALCAFHICDWRPATRDILLDRGLMGEGCIPLRQIRGWMERAGFMGMIEVEILSTDLWKTDQVKLLSRIRSAFLDYA